MCVCNTQIIYQLKTSTYAMIEIRCIWPMIIIFGNSMISWEHHLFLLLRQVNWRTEWGRGALIQDHVDIWHGVILRCFLFISGTFNLLTWYSWVWGSGRSQLPVHLACALLRIHSLDIKCNSNTSHQCPTLASPSCLLPLKRQREKKAS